MVALSCIDDDAEAGDGFTIEKKALLFRHTHYNRYWGSILFNFPFQSVIRNAAKER